MLSPAWIHPRTLFEPERPGGHLPQRFTQPEVEQFYLDGPELSPAGVDLMLDLEQELAAGEPAAQHPTLFLTGGIPGAGKSTVLNDLQQHRRHLVVIDPDHIKQHILADLANRNPDLRAAIERQPAWGSVVHSSSSVVATELLRRSLDSGCDVAFDSSMASDDPQRFRQYVADANHHDYQVHAIVTQVQPEIAERRAAERSREPLQVKLQDGSVLQVPGRTVPSDLIYETHQYLTRNVEAYLKEGLYDRMTLLDNNVDGEPPRVTSEQVRTIGSPQHFTSTELTAPPEQLSLFPDCSPTSILQWTD